MTQSQKLAKLEKSVELQNRTIRNLESMRGVATDSTVETCRMVIQMLEAQIQIVRMASM